MEIPALLDTLKTHGITVTVKGDRLKLVPGSGVPLELAEVVRAHKTEMLEYLRESEAQIQVGLSDLGLKVDQPHLPTAPDLLAWASELAEQDLTLPETISYEETRPRPVKTNRVSHYAAVYLREIAYARMMQSTGGWGSFTPEWSQKQIDIALGALRALREALEQWISVKEKNYD